MGDTLTTNFIREKINSIVNYIEIPMLVGKSSMSAHCIYFVWTTTNV